MMKTEFPAAEAADSKRAAVRAAWAAMGAAWSPLAALERLRTAHWAIDGLIPGEKITWLYGPSRSGKSFIAVDMAAAIASGRPWLGRQCDQSTVVYVAAEGGDEFHARRAAAELAAGACGGPLLVTCTRPLIGEPEGVAELMSLIQEATGERIRFEQVEKAEAECRETFLDYLDEYELGYFESMDQFEKLAREIKDAERHRGATRDELNKNGYQRKIDKATEEIRAYRDDLEDWDCSRSKLTRWARELARVRLQPPARRAALKYKGTLPNPPQSANPKNIFLVIDTYGKTALGDDKTDVARYYRGLLDLTEQTRKAGGRLTILVLDHVTKAGDSWLGSVAKLNDVDAMIEVRKKADRITMSCDKMRDAPVFEPISLKLDPFTLPDCTDSRGRPLTTAIVKAAEGDAVSPTSEMVMQLLETAGGECERRELHRQYMAHPLNGGKSAEAVRKAFTRAMTNLITDEVVVEVDGVVQTPTDGQV